MTPNTTEASRFLDVYVDHQIVDQLPVIKGMDEGKFKSQILEDRKGEGLVYIKVRKTAAPVEIVTPECPGGNCPLRTTPKQVEAQTALNTPDQTTVIDPSTIPNGHGMIGNPAIQKAPETLKVEGDVQNAPQVT